ncbi:hypothetical protein J1614_007726 [Plenodomus biglobosus]|nr:hypothetical protein J1614_007726 [Plenodomus biglobosus]
MIKIQAVDLILAILSRRKSKDQVVLCVQATATVVSTANFARRAAQIVVTQFPQYLESTVAQGEGAASRSVVVYYP